MTEDKKGTELVETPKVSLLAKFAMRYSVETTKIYDTLIKTAFKDAKTMEQVVALLVVADQYGLNPFTKEIYAFPDKDGGVVPVVSVDGWNTIAQNHPQYDGIEFDYSTNLVFAEEGAKECPEWIEVTIYRKDTSHPTVLREFLDECYKPCGTYQDGNPRKPGPWQTHTKRMLRHKALIQGYRTAFGFHGIYDPDEAANFIDIGGTGIVEPPAEGRQTRRGAESIGSALSGGLVQEGASAGKEGAKGTAIDPESDTKPEDDDGIDI